MGAKSPERVNVLFTSAGRRVELLRAFREAFEALQLAGSIVATDIDRLAPALQVADRAHQVPAITSPDYILSLASIVEAERIDMIFPLIDPDIPALAQGRSALERSGAKLVVIPLESVQITHDKWRTYEFFQQQGVPTPKTWKGSALPKTLPPFPLFLKPRSGSAGRQAVRLDDAQDLAYYLAKVPDALVQELLPGPEITSDITCDLQGRLLAVVSRERIEVRWGEVAKGKTVFDEEIVRQCARIAEGLKAIGPITVQCMLRQGRPHFTEVNARFGGGLPLGIAAGVPSPRWYLAMAAGIPFEAPPLGTYRKGLHLTRYDQSFFLDETELEGSSLRSG